MISVQNVYKRYQTEHGPGRWVLEDVSVEIPAKVNVGLIGANGAGKSTLLRLIGGVDQPTRGRIARDCAVSWPLGFGGGLQGSLTGRQNAKFVCRIHGHQDDIGRHVDFIQEFSELSEAFDEPVKTYSSGMQARLKFAISLAFDFDVYISDELTAVGDTAFRRKARAAFEGLAGRAGLIMVSHQEATLRDFCAAGIWLHDGRAHWFDDVQDALTAYKESLAIEGEDNNGPAQLTNAALERVQRQRKHLGMLQKGLAGEPALVGHRLGQQLIDLAAQMDLVIASEAEITAAGQCLAPGAVPVLLQQEIDPSLAPIELYDMNSQCTPVESP